MTEPVGWIYEDDEGRMMFSQMPHPDPLWEPVYKAKREWQGLTDEEVWEIPSYDQTSRMYRFARAIEAKLKEKNT